MLGLTKRVKNGLIIVDPGVELGLQLLLGHANHKVSDQLRDGLSNGTNRDLEISIDTATDLFNKDISAASRAWRNLILLLLLLLVLLDWHAILVVLWHGFLLRNDRGAVFLVVSIVDEHVVLLRINDGLDKFTAMVAFTLKDLDNDVHDLWSQSWASHENALNDG